MVIDADLAVGEVHIGSCEFSVDNHAEIRRCTLSYGSTMSPRTVNLIQLRPLIMMYVADSSNLVPIQECLILKP